MIFDYSPPTKPNQTKPNQTKPNQTKPNQTKPNQTKPNQTKPNQTKTLELIFKNILNLGPIIIYIYNIFIYCFNQDKYNLN